MLRLNKTLHCVRVAVSASLALGSASLVAAEWQTVVAGKYETIEIDKSRIARGFGGTTAWSRVNLGRAVPDVAGAYDAIEALNRYDCEGGRFTTLKRAYYMGETLVREEGVSKQKANIIHGGSVDERLFNEACKLRTVSEAQRIAVVAAQAMNDAQAGNERPTAMHADMRQQAGEGTARLMRVADAAPAERPKMIQLPAIDKAAAEAAAAGISAKPGAAPSKPAAAPVAPAANARPAPYAPAARAPEAYKSVEPRPVSRAVEMAASENRRTRELMLATSGPKRVSSKSADKKESNPAQDMHAHWGYDGAGAPANWGKLKGEYALCDSGQRQSPIDIREGIKVDLESIRFDYKPTRFRIVDNGHTIQVNVGEGSTINVMGKRFELVQFHFHKPSEERINGRPFDMVIHFVHKDYDNNLAVIAVLLERGSENPQIQTVWNNMPLEAGQELLPTDVLETIKLMPENRAYWTYMGSLTTPPCTENVLWMVMKQPVQVSPEQIAIFSRLYRNNARPVQPTNGRLVKESR